MLFLIKPKHTPAITCTPNPFIMSKAIAPDSEVKTTVVPPKDANGSSAVSTNTPVNPTPGTSGALSMGGVFEYQASWANWARLFMDILITIILLVVTATGSTGTAKALNLYQMPIYLKQDVPFGAMWSKIESDREKSAPDRLLEFKEEARSACLSGAISDHPMCVCIDSASNQMLMKNCLLQNPMPSVYYDWNIGVVSSALLIWFLASLATSVGTMPFINSYVDFEGKQSTIVVWGRAWRIMYVITTVCAFCVPLMVNLANSGGGKSHLWGVLNMLMWSTIALISMCTYNIKTFYGYITYHDISSPGLEEKSDGTSASVTNKNAGSENEHRTNDHNVCTMSVHNFILYCNLLVSAPAIATVLHVTQQWTEYHTIINTTLIVSTIFAVDGFSAEMANYWSHHATKQNIDIFYEGPSDDKSQNATDMHTQLGLIRLFAFLINSLMLLLLMTMSYPDSIGNKHNSSGIFVVVVVAFAAVFLAPDLVREFTERVSFNSIQFRLYGDFVLRVIVLFFVVRASTSDRVE